MPYLYGKNHNDFLKKYNDTGETTVSNKERNLFGKNK